MKKFLLLSTAAILVATLSTADAGWRGRRDTAIGIGLGLGALGIITGAPYATPYNGPYGRTPYGGNYYGNPDAGYYGDYHGSFQGRTYYPPPQYYGCGYRCY